MRNRSYNVDENKEKILEKLNDFRLLEQLWKLRQRNPSPSPPQQIVIKIPLYHHPSTANQAQKYGQDFKYQVMYVVKK